MVSRFVVNVGPYTITRDEKGVYSLLDDRARTLATSESLELIRASADFLLNPVAVKNAYPGLPRLEDIRLPGEPLC